MKLNRNDLKKIQYSFNSFSNRLLQADYQDYPGVLAKFLSLLNETPIINEYIQGCGTCDFDLEKETKEVRTSHGRCIFLTGDTEQEEVRNVYAILKYLVDNNDPICYGIAMGYSSSTKYQDKIKGFNDRFVMVLIRHIENYLTQIGIDMGLDEKVTYNVTVNNGQAIIATDNATVTATNNIGINSDELKKLIEEIRDKIGQLNTEDQEAASESLEAIESEIVAEKPKKSIIRTALTTLKTIKGVTEFAAAVASLASLLGTVI